MRFNHTVVKVVKANQKEKVKMRSPSPKSSPVQEIDYVIGMRDTILDDAAIAFSTGFYDGLGYGRNIEDAFELGTNAIIWEQASFSDRTRNRKMIPVDLIETESSESLPEHLKPILLKKGKKDGNRRGRNRKTG